MFFINSPGGLNRTMFEQIKTWISSGILAKNMNLFQSAYNQIYA